MLNPNDILALGKDEQAQVELAVAFIDAEIHKQVDAATDSIPTDFKVNRSELSIACGGGEGKPGLTLKVRSAVIAECEKNDWKVSLTDSDLVLSVKRKGGKGRPKLSDEEKAARKVARDAAKAAAAAADAPMHQPVEAPAAPVADAGTLPRPDALTADAPPLHKSKGKNRNAVAA